MSLSEKMEHVGQEAYEYAPEVYKLEVENTRLSEELDHFRKLYAREVEQCNRFESEYQKMYRKYQELKSKS